MPSILIAADEAGVRRSLRTVLEGGGHNASLPKPSSADTVLETVQRVLGIATSCPPRGE
jgi:CheY-like chemotaxis protein